MFAPLIEEALLRGHQVYCLHHAAAINSGAKGYLYPSLDGVPVFRNGKPLTFVYSDAMSFATTVRDCHIDVVVSINYYPWHIKFQDLVTLFGVKWVSIQYAFDMLPVSHLVDFPDRYFFFSDIWFQLTRTFNHPKKNLLLGDGVRCFGFPELDQKTVIDPARVRLELGIPEDKPVVLHLSFQYLMQENQLYSRYVFTENNPLMKLFACMKHPKYFSHVLHGLNNENVFKAIKKFCDRNDAYLLINGRQKSPIPPYIKGDKTVTDVSFYPADILKYLSISSVCFNFWSAVVTECIPFGVSNVCIAPSMDDIFVKNHPSSPNYSLFKHVLEVCPDIFNFDGITRRMTLEQIISELPDMRLEEFNMNPVTRNTWIQKFIYRADGHCSERIISEIETLISA
jgi:hypothetical protein